MSRLRDKVAELLIRAGKKAEPAIFRIYSGWGTYRYKRRQQRKKWEASTRWFTADHVGLLLGVLAIGVIAGGALVQYGRGVSARQMVVDLWANLGTELISIAITVLIIDALNRRRERGKEVEQEKYRVYLGLKSSVSEEVQLAVEKIRAYGWLSGDFLAGANLSHANLSRRELSWANLEKAWLVEANLRGADLRWARLSGANLQRANLQGADLLDTQIIMADLARADLQDANLQMANLLGADIRQANLEGANLIQANLQAANLIDANLKSASVSEGQLMYACSMAEAIMPDGSRYDGRFSLEGDLELARLNGLNPKNPEDMAEWYLVTPAEYLAGQAWYEENYDRLLAGWDYVAQHHGPKRELEGFCGPSIAEREILSRPQPPEAKVRPIRTDRGGPLPPRVDEDSIL